MTAAQEEHRDSLKRKGHEAAARKQRQRHADQQLAERARRDLEALRGERARLRAEFYERHGRAKA